jgi:hypothetical protein
LSRDATKWFENVAGRPEALIPLLFSPEIVLSKRFMRVNGAKCDRPQAIATGCRSAIVHRAGADPGQILARCLVERAAQARSRPEFAREWR